MPRSAPPSFDLSQFLPYRMSVAAQKLSAALAARYRDDFGISVAEWRVLVHVADAGAVSIREIHNRVSLDKSKASRAASRLEAEGYLSKKPNGDDRRLIALELTDKGKALMDRLLPLAAEYQTQLEARLGPDLVALNKALDEMMR